jgi:hypothetical protein
MAERRLSRILQAGSGLGVNWIIQATETYDSDDPAADPVNWGTEAELAFLDRQFTATGSQVEHLGMLLTFVGPDAKPTRSFAGAQVKIQPTYDDGTDPYLECWTLLGATWTLRRRIAIAAIARSGDTVVQELIFDPALFASDEAVPDAIWITLNTAVDVSLDWLVCHLYGDCTLDPETPCPPGTEPGDCGTIDCAAEPEAFECIPIPLPPDLPPLDPFEFPPILVDVLMPTTYANTEGVWSHPCPGPTGIRMYFGDLPTGGSVTVTIVDAAGLEFFEGTSQTISAAGVMNWSISAGFGGNDAAIGSGAAAGYLPPREVTHHVRFAFTRSQASPFTLLDILLYFWTYDLTYEEACFVDDEPPITGLPPAEDPPDDAGQALYQLVTEQWFTFADTAANTAEAIAAASAREAEYFRVSGGALNYGLRPEDGALLRDALENTAQYLNDAYDPLVGTTQDYTAFRISFTGLADGHVLAFRCFAVPIAAMLNFDAVRSGVLIPAYTLNPFRNGALLLPYNPAADIADVFCFPCVSSPCADANDEQSADLAQRLRWFRDYNVTPQLTKYAGAAIQPTAYHIARGVTEDVGFDSLRVHPYPVPDNPFAQTWTTFNGPSPSAALGRCHQWLKIGWAYLLTVRVYEPVATPIGNVVDVVYGGTSDVRFQVSSLTQLDGRWP